METAVKPPAGHLDVLPEVDGERNGNGVAVGVEQTKQKPTHQKKSSLGDIPG